MRYIKSYIHYDVSSYRLVCPICNYKAKSCKALIDHFFHRNWKDQKRRDFANKLREKTQNNFVEKAKHICPVCNDKFLRTLATHFNNSKDWKHIKYLSDKEKLIIKLFKSGKSPQDIEKEIYLNYKWVWRIIQNNLGKVEAGRISAGRDYEVVKKSLSYQTRLIILSRSCSLLLSKCFPKFFKNPFILLSNFTTRHFYFVAVILLDP